MNKTAIRLFTAGLLLASTGSVLAEMHYVDVNSTNATPPYTNWSTAATNIQDAVDVAVAGDEIVVTNGIYATGGARAIVNDSTQNRVLVDKPLSVRSVNGPQSTTIFGGFGGAYGRCVYLSSGASLSGFTLTNGFAYYGGGLFCESLAASASNCVVTSNSAYYGAGVHGGTLNNCTITGSGSGVGAAYECTLKNCTVSGNSRDGAFECTLTNCSLTGNHGLGAVYSGLTNCTLSGNFGGGAVYCTLNNCALTRNSNAGAYGCLLNNCTLTDNSGNGYNVGGASYSTLNNCIVYFNGGLQAANYDSSCTLNYCCTTPQPTSGLGNISVDPQLASALRLSAGSLCRGAGSAAYASGTDLDGETWASPPSIGCDEYYAGALTGQLNVAISASFMNVTVGFKASFTGLIEGLAAASSWDFGDGATVANQPYTSHAWAAPGNYAVVLRAYNESQPGGISATVTVHVVTQPVHYVAGDSGNPVAPYASWATAATNIQDAVDAATVPGALVLVTNGTYATGGRALDGYTTNRLVISKPVAVRSVNGPQVTIIDGGQLVRCVYLTNSASVSGFMLTNGGSGAFGGTLNNCVLSGNTSIGAQYCTLNNCAMSGNGYGASSCTLDDCTLTGNTYSGAQQCALNNCIAYFNGGASYDASSTLNYCCTTPQPTNGVGNISVDPQLASAWRLSAASPCRGAGSVAYASATDIDGEAWLSPPSIGCDEFQGGALTGQLSVGITASFTNVTLGYALQFTGVIQGRAATSVWDFGDGIAVTNQPYTSHAWTALGDYAVVLRAYNQSWPGGISATVTVHVVSGIHYVSASSTNPVAPYTSWATAAASIQVAINAAIEPGAQVLVTNGNYYPIYVPRLLPVRSVNGPDSTIIYGGYYLYSGSSCAYLAAGASLSGFTLTEGFAEEGGGVFCESRTAVVSNCVLSGNSAGGRYSFYNPDIGSLDYIVYYRGYGGAAYGGTLNNCTVSDNSVTGYNTGESSHPGGGYGGGAYNCTLNNCVLSGNSAVSDSVFVWDFFPYFGHYEYTLALGGGADQCTLNNCTLRGNSAFSGGGGASGSTLNICTVTGNSNGGASGCTLNNCALTGNDFGASSSALNNCTLIGNGNGASSSTLRNCITYFNTGTNYDSYSTLNYCCTTPQPTNGLGNISSQPQLASFSHLSAGSPCRGAGNAAYASGTDIDGEAWLNPPSIGCDEYHAGAATGPLSVGITASFTNMAIGFTVQFTALIEGRTTASVWDFGDGITVTNQPYPAHAWTAPGDYAVVLRAYNESQPGGISATVTVHVVNTVHYVTAGGTNPMSPYTSWATAATNIQDAVNAATVPGAVVLVTNGIYAPIAAYKLLTVRSVNGPLFTVINGGRSNRCISLATGASLSGFTLTNGLSSYGGGANGGTLNNCTLTGNSATTSGGGAYSSTLNNCTLAGNSATTSGGGAYSSTLNNCALTGNTGGGASGSTLKNCIVYFNSGANYDSASTLNYCCTTPLPTNGVGNISSDPQLASASHLSFFSPCIGKGNHDAASGVDIDGEPWANPPSMGCDELHAGATTGPLTVGITASFTTVTVGYPMALTGLIEGRTDLSLWSFGDGALEINQPYATHSWSATGDYLVSLWAFNDSYPGGISATTTVHVVEGVHYVAANSATPVAPYASWATAATNIQDAVDAAVEPGGQVLVTNGTYATGGWNGNRVAVDKPLTLRSVNGPQFTAINGGQSNRCVSLANEATLTG